MIKEQIAAKYSQALFDLGQEQEILITLQDDIKKLWQLINENEELKQILFHHRILPGEKKRVLDKVLAESINIYLLNFIKLLIDKRREYFLETIVNSFIELVNEEEKVLEIKVITAVPLKEKYMDQLKNKLNKLLDYNIKFEKKVDPTIIGGLILKTKHHILDGSIKKRLENIRKNIDKIPVSKLGV